MRAKHRGTRLLARNPPAGFILAAAVLLQPGITGVLTPNKPTNDCNICAEPSQHSTIYLTHRTGRVYAWVPKIHRYNTLQAVRSGLMRLLAAYELPTCGPCCCCCCSDVCRPLRASCGDARAHLLRGKSIIHPERSPFQHQAPRYVLFLYWVVMVAW